MKRICTGFTAFVVLVTAIGIAVMAVSGVRSIPAKPAIVFYPCQTETCNK